MKSLDELREETKILAENHIDTDELVRIADAIEREVEEKYIESPKGTNKKPVRLGCYARTYPFDGEKKKVVELTLTGFGWKAVFEDGNEEPLYRVSPCEPPTVEDVLRNFAYCLEDGATDKSLEEIVTEYAPKLQLREKNDD